MAGLASSPRSRRRWRLGKVVAGLLAAATFVLTGLQTWFDYRSDARDTHPAAVPAPPSASTERPDEPQSTPERSPALAAATAPVAASAPLVTEEPRREPSPKSRALVPDASADTPALAGESVQGDALFKYVGHDDY